MRILRALAPFEHVRLRGNILFAILGFDLRKRLLLRFLRDTHRVGTHVGDEARCALAREVDAFIKLLCNKHGELCRESELARGFLLHAARRKRRGSVAHLFGDLPVRHGEFACAGTGDHRVRIRFVVQFGLFAIEPVKLRFDGFARALMFERCGNRPILIADEVHDLLLTVADDARRDRLHTPRGKPFAYLRPEDRADLIANEPVKHAARLLRVHKVHVDRARGLYGFFDRAGCDLVEHDAALCVRIKLQDLRKVPGDRFPLHIRVGCKVDGLRIFRFLADALKHITPAAQRDVLRRKIMLDVHAELAFGKVAHMAVGCDDLVALP